MKHSELTILLAMMQKKLSTPGELAKGLGLGHETVRRALLRLHSRWFFLRKGNKVFVNQSHTVVKHLSLAIAGTSLQPPWLQLMTYPPSVDALAILYNCNLLFFRDIVANSVFSPMTVRKALKELISGGVVSRGEKRGAYVLNTRKNGVTEWAAFAAEVREWLPFDQSFNPIQAATEDPRLTMALLYGSYAEEKHVDNYSDKDLLAVANDPSTVHDVQEEYGSQPGIDVYVTTEQEFRKTLKRQPAFAKMLASGKPLKGEELLKRCLNTSKQRALN